MAKKKPTTASTRVNKRVKERDKATLGKIVGLADNVSKCAFKGNDICLHIFADNRGSMVGNITIVDKGDEINCRRMGSGGYAIPSIVEPDVIEFRKCDAKFVLHVEKGTVWNRFNEDRFWEGHNCILTHGGGQPPRGVRRLLQRFSQEAKLDIICLLDCDPWGHYIYSVIKQGSIALAFESERLAIPDAKFLGIRAKDYDECDLSDDVQIDLNDNDRKRAGEIAAYPS